MSRRAGEWRPSAGRAGRPRRLTAEQRCQFLSAASRELASTLDYEKTVAGIAGRPLPYLGDWCIVDLIEEADRLRRVAIVHPDPQKRDLVRGLLSGWPPSRADPFGIPSVVKSGEYELVSEIDDELLSRVAGEAENLRILRELGAGSLVTVPMRAHDQIIGAITYVAETAHAFSAADVEMALDLAVFSALAVTNARLHRSLENAQRAAEASRREAEEFGALAGRLNERLLVSAIHEMEAAEIAASLEEAKSESMASLSHDLRSPLTAILGYTDLLLGGHLGPLSERQVASLTRVASAVQQILRLVDQILLRARLTARREPLHVGEVDVAAVAWESLDLIRPLAERKNIALEGRIPAQPLVLATDADKVRQILLNLLSNAIKFTDDGKVCLTVHADRDGVDLQVSDTGRGIPAEEQEHIFDRFRQLGDRTDHAGSGLGLAISRGLADLLGGSLTLQSEPGRGSTFTVRLRPYAGPTQEVPAAFG